MTIISNPRSRFFAMVAVVGALLPTGLSPANAATMHGRVPLASCSSNLAEQLTATHGAQQIITVDATATDATTATLTLFQREQGCYRITGGPWIAEVGRRGLSAHRTEGDLTTPIGAFTIGTTMYGNEANPGVSYPYHRLVCGDWWDEDSSSAAYNQFAHVSCGSSPSFAGDSEALWRVIPQYNYMAVINYNTSPAVKHRGSGIFLHVSIGEATTGCVALPAGELLQTLRWLQPNLHPLIVIGAGKSITNL